MDIHQPHDKFFKKSFGIKEVAADFITANIAPADLKKLDLKSLTLQKNSFIDEKYKAHYSDVLYKVHSDMGDGYLYFLLEHQSTSDPFIVPKLLQYMAMIMKSDMFIQLSNNSNQDKLKLPVIYPFVVYSGPKKYKWPQQLTIKLIGGSTIDFSDSLIELNDHSFQKLLKSGKAAAAQFILKESWRKDFCQILENNPELCKLIKNSPYARAAMTYMVDQDPHRERILKFINDKILKNEIMGNLKDMKDEAKKEGFQKGFQEGFQEGFQKAIIRLLANGIAKPEIAKILGMSMEKLNSVLQVL